MVVRYNVLIIPEISICSTDDMPVMPLSIRLAFVLLNMHWYLLLFSAKGALSSRPQDALDLNK